MVSLFHMVMKSVIRRLKERHCAEQPRSSGAMRSGRDMEPGFAVTGVNHARQARFASPGSLARP